MVKMNVTCLSYQNTAFHTAAGAELQAAADLELLDIQAVEDTADKFGL